MLAMPERSLTVGDDGQSSLSIMPFELWIEILHHLDWPDILRMRLVCKAVHAASVDRNVWYSLLRNPSSSDPLDPFLTDKDPARCTAAELEAMLLSGPRRHVGWGDASNYREREISTVNLFSSIYRKRHFIIPGGRWLIIVGASGFAAAFDLQDTKRPHIPLCPHVAPLHVHIFDAAAEIQESGCHTDLCLAIWTGNVIAVWLIKPIYDDAGQVEGLCSELVSSVPTDPLITRVWSFSVSRSFVGYLHIPDDNESIVAVAIDYRQTTSQDDHTKIPTRFISHPTFYEGSVIWLSPTNTAIILANASFHHWDLLATQPVYNGAAASPPDPGFLSIAIPDNDGELAISPLPLFLPNGTCRVTWADHPRMYTVELSRQTIEVTTLCTKLPQSYPDRLNHFELGNSKFFHFIQLRRRSWVKGLKLARDGSTISSALYTPNSVKAVDSWSRPLSVDFHSGTLGFSGYQRVVVVDFPAWYSFVLKIM